MAKKLKWGTIEYLNVLIDEYFTTAKVPNIAGLCLALNIGKDCWQYYLTERWKLRRKSEEEIEAISKGMEEKVEDEAFEELLEISSKCYISEDEGSSLNVEDDDVKTLVSAAIKRAALKLESFVIEESFTAKNPAGAIFYAKAALGYRETAPEESNQIKTPSQITINILPQPAAPTNLIEAVNTTYSVLPEKAGNKNE